MTSIIDSSCSTGETQWSMYCFFQPFFFWRHIPTTVTITFMTSKDFTQMSTHWCAQHCFISSNGFIWFRGKTPHHAVNPINESSSQFWGSQSEYKSDWWLSIQIPPIEHRGGGSLKQIWKNNNCQIKSWSLISGSWLEVPLWHNDW